MRSGDPGDYNDYLYEYDSGVGSMFQLNFESNTEIYVVNRGSAQAVGRAFLYKAEEPANTPKFDSGVAVVPGGGFVLIQHGPRQNTEADLGLYWARILATSPNLVLSMRIWRTEAENEPPISDVYFAPNDFARYELPPAPHYPVPPISPIRES